MADITVTSCWAAPESLGARDMDRPGYWGWENEPRMRGLGNKLNTAPLETFFTVLLGFLKCNPAWVKNMVLAADELEGDLPDDVMPALYYDTDDAKPQHLGVSLGHSGDEQIVSMPELQQLLTDESSASTEVLPPYEWWTWGLAEAAVRGGWRPVFQAREQPGVDDKIENVIHAVSGLEAEEVPTEGVDLWDQYLQYADLTPLWIQVDDDESGNGLLPADSDWFSVTSVAVKDGVKEIHYAQPHDEDRGIGGDKPGRTRKLDNVQIKRLVRLKPVSDSLYVAYAGDVVRQKFQDKVKVEELAE